VVQRGISREKHCPRGEAALVPRTNLRSRNLGVEKRYTPVVTREKREATSGSEGYKVQRRKMATYKKKTLGRGIRAMKSVP